jgi:hypothetical protein
LTVVAAVLELLAAVGSSVELDTDAVFDNPPADPGITTIVTVALAPFAKAPTAQVTVLVPLQVPAVDELETRITPAGNVSVTDTADAASGPLFTTTRL